MTHEDYWGATGADLPRVPAQPADGTPLVVPASGAEDLDLTAPLPAVDVPRPEGVPSALESPAPRLPDPVDPVDLPLFRSTARIPTLDAEGRPAAADDARAAPEASGMAEATAGYGPPGPPLADPEPAAQHRRLVPVLLLAVVAVAGVVGWRLLPHGLGLTAIPVPPSATAVEPTPGPTTPVPSGTSGVPPVPGPAYVPPPLPHLPPAAVRTITQTVLVTVPAPHETPAGGASPPDSAAPSSTPSVGVTSPPIVTTDWRFGPAGVGPITLGMPAVVAAQQGYLVPDAAAPEGFVSSPALRGVELWVAQGVVSGVIITDPAIRSTEGMGVGTPLAEVHRLFGDAIVMVTLADAAGVTRSLPGLEYPSTYLAFVPTGDDPASPSPTGPATPAPAGSPTPSGSATLTPTPTPPTGTPSASGSTPTATPSPTTPAPTATAPAASGTVEAVIIALKGSPAGTPSPSSGP